MSFPTGMGAVTGQHYEAVAAQMDAYVNGSPPTHFGGHFQGPLHLPHMFSSQGQHPMPQFIQPI
jgi:hypothetical protein